MAQKPVDLVRWLLRSASHAKACVLSVFEGAGTGAIASLLEGRDVVCVDFCMEMIAQSHARVKR